MSPLLKKNTALLSQLQAEKGKVAPQIRGGGSGEAKLYMDDDVSYVVRLFKGNYGEDGKSPTFLYHRGWSRKVSSEFRAKHPGRSGQWIICNCHGRTRKVDCVPCKDDDATFAATGKHSFRPMPVRAANIIHFGRYHLVPASTDPKDKGRFYRNLCTAPKECNGCQAGHPLTMWKKTSLDFDPDAWRELGRWDRQIQRKCKNCAAGEVLPVSATCPSCGRSIQGGLDRLLLMDTQDITCPHCSRVVGATLEWDCCIHDKRTGTLSKGCGNPAFFEIWDCDIEIMQTPAKGGKGKEYKMLSYIPGPVDDAEIVKAMREPSKFSSYDFMAPNDQALKMGIENPYTAG
jgi:hypothetical protein